MNIKKIKVIVSFLLVIVICFTMQNMAFASETSMLGDVDENGKLTVRDALLDLKAAADIIKLSEEQLQVADVSGDSIVNATDALLIFKKVLGDIWYFPVEDIEASGVIYIAGDSIASEHDIDDTYERQVVGWGSIIGDLFTEDVTIVNEARSGRSSKSYISSSNYYNYIGKLSKGDYYLISFGHNDEKESDLTRYTDPYGASDEKESFKWYLKNYYIEPALKVGAYPILISSVVRCNFDGEVLATQSHEKYAVAMEQMVEEYKLQGIEVGYIDLHQITADYYNQVGKLEAESLHAYTATSLDTTHYCDKGAKLASDFITYEMKEQGLDICKYLKNN